MSDYLMGQEAFEDQLGGYLSDSKNRLGKLRDLMQRVKGGKNTKLSHNIQESINSEIKFQQVIEQRIAPVLINEGYSEDDWKGIMEKIEQIITKAQDTYNQIMTNFPTLNRISLSAQTKASKAQIRMNAIDEIMYSIFGEKSVSKGINQKSDFQKKIISKAKKSQLGTKDLVFKIKELTELKKRAKTPEGKDLLSQAIQALTQYKTEIYNTAYTRVKIGGTYKRVPKESSNKNEQKRIDEAVRLFKKDLTIIGDNIQQNFKENEQIIRKAQQNAQKIHEQPNIDVFGKLQNIGQIGKKMPTRQFKPETKSGSARFTTVPSDTSVLKLLPGQFRSVRTKSADHFLGTDYEFLDPQVVQELQELKQQGKSVSQISHSAISKKFLPTSAYFEAQNKNTQEMISAARDALKTATSSNKNIKAAENQLLSALTSSSASYGTGMHKLSEEFNRQALDSNYVGSIDFSDLNKLMSEMASNPLEWLRKHGGIDNPLAGLFTKSQTGQWILRDKAIKDIPALIKWLSNRDVRQVEQGTGGIYRTRSGQYVSLMGQSDIVVETEPNKLTYVDTKFRKESVRTFEEFTQALAGVIGLNSQLEALGTQERVTRVAFAHMAPGSGKVTEQIHDISDMQVQEFSQILDIIGDLQAGKIDTAQAIASLPPTVQAMFIKQLGGVLGKSGRKTLQEQGMYFLESEDASAKNMVVTKQMIKFGKYNPNISSSRIDEAVKLIRSQQKEQWNDEGFIKNIGKQLGTPGQGIINALKEGNADKVEAEIQKYLEQLESNTTQVISYPQFYDPETKTTFTMSKIAGQWESAKTEEDKRAILRKFTNVINNIPQMEKRRLQAYSIRAKARKIVGEEDTSENARNIRFAKALMKEGNLSFNFRNINKIEEMISGKTTEDFISSDLDKQILDELGPEGEQIAKAVKTGDVKKIQDAITDYKKTFLYSSQQEYKPYIRPSQILEIMADVSKFQDGRLEDVTYLNKASVDKIVSLSYRVPQIQKKIEESFPKDKTWTAENINWKSIQEALDLAYGSGIEFSNWDLQTIVEQRQVEELSKVLPSLYEDLKKYSDSDRTDPEWDEDELEKIPPELLQYLEEYIMPFILTNQLGAVNAVEPEDNRPISIPEQTDISSNLSAKKIKALFATAGTSTLSNQRLKDAIDLWTSEDVDKDTRYTAFADIFGSLYWLKPKGFESINAADLSKSANKALIDSVKNFKKRIESLSGVTNAQKSRVLNKLYRMAGIDSVGFDTPENLARGVFRMITAPQDVFQYMEKLSPEQVGATEWTNKLMENINALDTSFKGKSSLEVILKALDMDSSLIPEEGQEGAEAFQSKYGTNALNIVRRLISMRDYLGRLKETDPEYQETINNFGQIFQDAMLKRKEGYDFWQEYIDRGGTSLGKYLAETGFGPLDVIRGDNNFWQTLTKGKGNYNLSIINPAPATRSPQTLKSRPRYNKQTEEGGQTPTAFGLLAKGKYDDSKQSYYYKVSVPKYGYPLIYSSNQLLNPNTNVEVPLGDKETVGIVIGSATSDDLKAVKEKYPQLKIKPISKVVGTGISSVGTGSSGTVGGVPGGNMGNFQANTINITANNVNVTGTNVLQNGTNTGITWLPSNTSTFVNSGVSQDTTSQNTQNSGFTNSARNIRQLNALLKEKLKIEKEIVDLQRQQQKFAQGTHGYEATRKYFNINKKKVSALKKEVGLMLLGSTPQISDDMFKQINSEYKLQLKEYKLKSDIKSATPLSKDVSEFEKLLRQRTRQQYELLKTQKRYNTINPFSGEIPFLAEQMIFGQQNLEDLDVQIQRMVQSGTIPQDVAQSITARFAKDEEKNKLLVGGMKGGSGNIFEAIGEQMKQLLFNFTQFGAAYKVIGLLRTSINNVIKSAQQLDKVMTDLRIVTGGTKEETSNLMSSYAQLGGELAATTTEVANAANSWLRQGYSINETNELISASLHLSKLGMIESGQATEYLMKVTYIYN